MNLDAEGFVASLITVKELFLTFGTPAAAMIVGTMSSRDTMPLST